jgi:MSHA pilin protein MshD
MIRKQALAIAESLMEEIQLQPFTFCLPTDANARTAASVADCTGGAAGSEDVLPAAARVSNVGARDANNVADYRNFDMSPIRDVTGFAPALLADYRAVVAISQVGGTFGLAVNDVLQIEVTVTGRGETLALTGYRFRYAPRSVP